MAVLQLVKEDPKADNYNRKGVYKAHMLVAVYEDSEIKEPPSPSSRLYFLKVPGERADYLHLLEDNDELVWYEGKGRKKFVLDVDRLKKRERDDMRTKGEATVSEPKAIFLTKFKLSARRW